MGNSSSSKSSISTSLFNEADEEEYEEVHEEVKERPRRWLLDSSFEEDNAITESEIKSGGGEETFHALLQNEEIISRILMMYCIDLLDNLLTLRLVNRSFMKIVDQFNFISFHVFENASIEYVIDDEDVKQQQLTCKRMRLVRKILENITSNKRQDLPCFLSNISNKRDLLFTFNLKERENITKISNPFLQISKYLTGKMDQYFLIPSIEIYLEINQSSVPVHFNMLLISEETSSFEEYLFRYSISISEEGEWETKVFPMHKRQFFSSPKNNAHQVQPIINRSNNSINNTQKIKNRGKYKIVFSFSNNFQLHISTIDIQHNYSKSIDIVPLLSEDYQNKQLATIQNLIRDVKISCSSSDLNICKRVSFKTSFGIS